MALNLARKVKNLDVANRMQASSVNATMQGLTGTSPPSVTRSSTRRRSKAQFTGTTLAPGLICLYSLVKLKAGFLSGDYAEALAAANKAKQLLEAIFGWIAVLIHPLCPL